jgi:hypothetical protein
MLLRFAQRGRTLTWSVITLTLTHFAISSFDTSRCPRISFVSGYVGHRTDEAAQFGQYFVMGVLSSNPTTFPGKYSLSR